jgi:cytochrome c-type biogenesis protein CcmH/NrfF
MNIEQADIVNKKELRRIVRRMMRMGKNSEQIKEWFVAEIPHSLSTAQLQPMYPKIANGKV